MTIRKVNWSLFAVALVMAGLVFVTSGCNKKSSETSSGGGASNQSVVTLVGAAS
jgi:hypothetical protein